MKNPETLLRKLVETARFRGPRIIWTPDGLGAGNYLYLWLGAFKDKCTHDESRVLYKENMDQWLDEFPRLQSLTAQKNLIGAFQKRTIYWGQEFGVDFETVNLNDFIRHIILSSISFQKRIDKVRNLINEETIVINVRRGDYYSNKQFRSEYGFNIPGYVDEALNKYVLPARTVAFVSDDLAWCNANLGPIISDRYEIISTQSTSALDDLAVLSTAPQLILANSTFSYWGAYIRDVHLAHDGRSRAIAPGIHSRRHNHGKPWQINPEWQVISNIAGGWAERR